MNNKKILLSLFLVSILSLSPANANFDYADSPEFALDLLSFRLGGAYDYADSGDFSLDLYPVNRSWADSGEFTLTPVANIQVSPSEYDFGDVELGSSGTAIVTISNVGDANLTVSDIAFDTGSSSDFTITASPLLPVVLVPAGFVDVGLAFAPSALGYFEATLEILSDDPCEPLVQVSVGGVGVSEELPPEGQIAAILSFFDAAVEAGSLEGDGPGGSAENRLNALQNMIEACGDLIEDELYEEACGQLAAALKKCDGQPNPPDFVTGPAALVLRDMLVMLRTTLGCPI
jgi:hypothetical protein